MRDQKIDVVIDDQRNPQLIHEYMESPEQFANALNAGNDYAIHLVAVVAATHGWLSSLGLGEGELLGNATS